MATFKKPIEVAITDAGFNDAKYGRADVFKIEAGLNAETAKEIKPSLATQGEITKTELSIDELTTAFGATVKVGDKINVVVTAMNGKGNSSPSEVVPVDVTAEHIEVVLKAPATAEVEAEFKKDSSK
ncbi:hypothetical protein ACFY1P_08155 [Streptomyces sp. NPDC001407]|uniref:hypothetical protein n=1 Tax=Streptomyces sp. NPDC001407 TaxID=3364573 RepID=UPI003692DC68